MPSDTLCVFRHHNALLVSHVRNVLASAGIQATLRNMTLAGGAGELPLDQCEAEVWIAPAELTRAESLVKEALEGPANPGSAWTCPTCGERLDGAFDACWQCGADRPGEP